MEPSNRAPSTTGKSIEDYYEIGSRLTQESVGANAEVLRAVRRSDGKHFAVKVLRVGHTREDRSQIRALQSVNHVGIIKLEDWFETSTSLYLVMELALGGELFTRIQHRGRLSEREAAAVVKQMLEAIGHMHSRGLVHCDLKPENILYADMSENSPLKIADFGFAQFLPGRLEKLKQTLGGTPSYTAPEILVGQPYDGKVDMWSLGVILYILLSGIKPFKVSGRTPEELRAAVSTVLRGEYTFVEPHFTNVSAEAKDLIARLLVVDPKQRLSWDQALAHQWITGLAQDTPLGAHKPLSPRLTRIPSTLRSANLRKMLKQLALDRGIIQTRLRS
ncbi:hypothetical protein GUITHDRAFT_158278 [Guillardia theta CCMP2712]|uniref:Protein kinase domain-containing protein n=1 Tax=Guillardia theta (strain CCMP2712) TaxID=905079 RepID=L1IXL7_GUITC|nr:hypothetical protein GUITHDRAFT_158278 [Guillardia theta CCMP2712]EKX40817.1 hypothetical protein GUITHDRAFT_158278 [Guillardia theta CCMP2712]|eukprot:XP_005827797.1 hypothetical protein GUITHDRAFT_158278 [Guillardia theta CCMP2712]